MKRAGARMRPNPAARILIIECSIRTKRPHSYIQLPSDTCEPGSNPSVRRNVIRSVKPIRFDAAGASGADPNQ